jgi:hypothetical protein
MEVRGREKWHVYGIGGAGTALFTDILQFLTHTYKHLLLCVAVLRQVPTFKYSRKVQSEKGVVMLSRGYLISNMAVDRKKNVLVPMKGKLYICTAYRSTDQITFLAYDPKSR